ncbi:hypothetical protein ACFXPS_07270 [Nocardia sp. NPDC059091]|uniref:hypothetical protein n=1 Tax=unclassified Nocardia TaxID=2637762 RepID=UPI00368BFE3E
MAGEPSEPSSRYLYERLGKERFQELCAALLKHCYPDATCYPVGESDGGRDITLDRDAVIFQVKWSKRQPPNPATWLNQAISRETPSIRRLVAAGAREYILMTSVAGTATPDIGSMDKLVKQQLETHSKVFGIIMRCEWRADIDARIASAPEDLVWSFPEMLAGTEAIRYLAETGPSDQAMEFGWNLLDRLAVALRDRTGFALSGPEGNLEIDRVEARHSLLDTLLNVAGEPSVVIVSGEPDIGKSALTVKVAEELRSRGGCLATLSLYDLPETMVELETALGTGFSEVLASRQAEHSLIVIDGAEAVLEGKSALLSQLATASLRAGFGVVAVTRTDATVAVADSLSISLRATGIPRPCRTHEVPLLLPSELLEIAEYFPRLSGLADQQRPGWVFGRLGLIDMLLRSGDAAALPDRPLSEADVFSAIWSRVVRRPTAATRDARHYTLLMLARRRLLPDSPPASAVEVEALPSLRMDGLLLRNTDDRVWSASEDFANDLIRDFAVAMLILCDGWSVLREAGAPRWTLRATRLACQVTFASPRTEFNAEYARLLTIFRDLAKEFGRRWAEVPLEAVLTAGDSRPMMEHVWPVSPDEDRRDLIRLAVDRYTYEGVGDPAILGPLVDHAYLRIPLEDRSVLWPGSSVEHLVLAWLRGLLLAETDPSGHRTQVRALTLTHEWHLNDSFPSEVSALLGPDLDEHAERFLRDRGATQGIQPFGMRRVLESRWATESLASNNLALLADITESYYCGGATLAPPVNNLARILLDTADWVPGPFTAMIGADPAVAIRVVQTLLNDFAKRDGEERAKHISSEINGAELEFPDGVRRFCYGSFSHWDMHWGIDFRAAHEPAFAGLSALKRYAESLIESEVQPIGRVVEMLLGNCHNLAMPGLVVSLLIDHLDQVQDELDCWLRQPEVWNLERHGLLSHRFMTKTEGGQELLAQRTEVTLSVAVWRLVTAALIGRSDEYMQLLGGIGAELLQRSERLTQQDAEYTRACAALLDAGNYRLRTDNDVVVVVDLLTTLPALVEVPEEQEPSSDEISWQTMNRIGLRYMLGREDVLPHIAGDLRTVRALECDLPTVDSDKTIRNTIAQVSLAAVVAHARSAIRFGDDDIHWATTRLLAASADQFMPRLGFEHTLSGLASSPSTSHGLLYLFSANFHHVPLDFECLNDALEMCVKEPLSNFGKALEDGTSELWEAPCRNTGTTRGCVHQMAMASIESWICHHAPAYGDRGSSLWLMPPTEALSRTERLDLGALAGPITACYQAAESRCCVSEQASVLLKAMLMIQRRIKAPVRTTTSEPPCAVGKAVPHVLASEAVQGRVELLREHLKALANSGAALQEVLYGLAWQATHRAEVRRALPHIWPGIIRIVLDSRTGSNTASDEIAYLLPAPTAEEDSEWSEEYRLHYRPPEIRRPAEVAAEASKDWITPDQLGSLIDEWVQMARGNAQAVDQLVLFARTTDVTWQATVALRLMEALIDYKSPYRCKHIPQWLTEIRRAVTPGSDAAAAFLRIVDALVAHGDRRVVQLQLEAE